MNEVAPDTVVSRVRTLVETHYVFPEAAADISRVLADGLAAGRYPASARSLAETVTADLQSVNGDKHLRLLFHEEELAEQAPGGLRSPQLSALLDQLQWITLAGKPDGDRLRIVAEGECTADATARQLSDLLNGVLVLAQTGLNDSKARKQLDPEVREAYLDLVKGADVSRIDRGETKTVRLVFDVTPKFLQAARTTAPPAPPAPRTDAAPKRGALHKK